MTNTKNIWATVSIKEVKFGRDQEVWLVDGDGNHVATIHGETHSAAVEIAKQAVQSAQQAAVGIHFPADLG